jgi:hypothetical protein
LEAIVVKRLFEVNEAQEMPDRGKHRLADVISREVIGLENHNVHPFPRKH